MLASSRSILLAAIALAALLSGIHPVARAADAKPAPTVPAILTSDIHFDPFHDPGQVKALAAAPVSEWPGILTAPASPHQQEAFDSLQQTCHARGVDTSFALLASSLQAMHARQPDARFMLVAGDLIAHAFPCRYKTLFPDAKPGDYEAFVLKTLSFVIGQLRTAFPGMPVYAALGNNDSGCGDYQLDESGDFLAETGKIIAEGLPARQQAAAIKDFSAHGDYSIAMAEPMRNTRLIALDDLFMSGKYTTCAGKPNPAPAAAQISWLQKQLADARAAKQKVWVIGHIPPGIDPYSTVARFRNVCGGQSPVEFLASDQMADLLVEYADVVRLAVFAHTHMDEMRLLGTPAAAPAGDTQVAVKITPSISPVNGNTPSFTVARVDPASARLVDYDVVEASNLTGIGAQWTTEYNYSQVYREPQFSPSALGDLLRRFKADPEAKADSSQAYIHSYFVGDKSRELSPFWPEYVCSLNNYTASSFAACVCPSATK